MAIRGQQVSDLIVIYFNHGRLNSHGVVLGRVRGRVLEDLPGRSGYNSRLLHIAYHRVRLPAACLSIGEDTDIISVENTGYQEGHILEDGLLSCGWGENAVKRETALLGLRITKHTLA